ncbi:MAG: hypothetical protein KJ718_00420 [Nanoarchaeota archaeon]|nr:hypothetical protein [Nanoarchaeota archaeon]MBU1051005.1 hypothetical protein [Nanoarchaeota archaeon]MBU1988986.1 hypothetical protein [Nanoarchaeota archaeon]
MAERKTFGGSLLRLIGQRPKSVVERMEQEVESQIEAILEGCKETTTYSRENNVRYCDIFGDISPIHRDKNDALAFPLLNLEDTPIAGILLAATGEKISRRAIARLRDYWGYDKSELAVIGQEVVFRDPAYPDQEVSWSFSGYTEREGEGLDITLAATAKKRPVVEVTTRLGKELGTMPAIAGPISSGVYIMGPEKLRGCYECTGEEIAADTQPVFLPIFSASFTPSELLHLLKAKTGKIEGANRRMRIRYFAQPREGLLQVDVFPPTKRESRYLYKFRAITSQDTKPVCYTEVTCAAPETLNLSLQPREMEIWGANPTPSDPRDTETS